MVGDWLPMYLTQEHKRMISEVLRENQEKCPDCGDPLDKGICWPCLVARVGYDEAMAYARQVKDLQKGELQICQEAAEKEGHTFEEMDKCTCGQLRCFECPWKHDWMLTPFIGPFHNRTLTELDLLWYRHGAMTCPVCSERTDRKLDTFVIYKFGRCTTCGTLTRDIDTLFAQNGGYTSKNRRKFEAVVKVIIGRFDANTKV